MINLLCLQEEAKPEAKAEAKPADKTAAGKAAPAAAEGVKKRSPAVKRKLAKHNKHRHLAANLEDQFTTGRLYAAISSRPGQCGRADGYVLEGRELEFYLKKMQKGKKGKAGKE
jgi:small subunit ribosomal protein S8e